MDYKKAVNFIINRRKSELEDGYLNYLDLIKTDEILKNLDKSYRASCLDFSPSASEKQIALKKSIDDRLVQINAYSLVYPPAKCPICNDTAYDNGKFCRCVKAYAISQGEISFPLYSFSQSNPSIFGANATAYQGVQDRLLALCDKAPYNKRKTVALLGKTGTGKTFLASCMADKLIKKNLSVVFITAFEMVERMLKYHTTFDATKLSYLSPLLDCDFLFIDDLGSESVYKNVTKEYFFHIVNERRLANRTTVVTSNLNMDEIAIRYGERTASRLFDKSTCYAVEFNFDDERKLKIE